MIVGGAGNDVEFGNGGGDQLDRLAFFAIPSPGELGEVHSSGSDRLDGGPGSDTFNGIEWGDPEPDTIACGQGGEAEALRMPMFLPSDEGMLPGGVSGPGVGLAGDAVALGGGDTADTNCEAIGAGIRCPQSADSACVGITSIGGAAARGATAPAGARAAAKPRRHGSYVELGSGKFKVSPGSVIPVGVVLKRKRVNRLLGKRNRARARQTAIARSGTKRLKLRGKRFTLVRG